MNKNIYIVLGLVVLCVALFAFGGTKEALAQVQVNINIATPPPLQFAGPPDVCVVPSAPGYVYMVPNYDGLYFYGGTWYRFYNGYWFRSPIYNGYWEYIPPSMVPQVVIVIPPEYIHYVPYGYYRIHYNDLHRHWRTWDEQRHWHNYDWYKHEKREDVQRERYSHIENDRHQRGGQKPEHQQGQGQQHYEGKPPQHPQGLEHQQQGVQKPQQQGVKKQQQQGQVYQQQGVKKQQQQGQGHQQQGVKKQQEQGEREH